VCCNYFVTIQYTRCIAIQSMHNMKHQYATKRVRMHFVCKQSRRGHPPWNSSIYYSKVSKTNSESRISYCVLPAQVSVCGKTAFWECASSIVKSQYWKIKLGAKCVKSIQGQSQYEMFNINNRGKDAFWRVNLATRVQQWTAFCPQYGFCKIVNPIKNIELTWFEYIKKRK